MKSFTLRKMTNKDYPWVYQTKKDAFKKYIVENWGSWDSATQKEYFQKFIDKYRDNLYIIRSNKTDIGFYAGKILDNGNYHIGTIVIIPDYQHKGIGTRILWSIINKHKNRNIEVKYFKKNPVGHLYSRLGFIPYDETKYHYHVIKYCR